MWSVKNCCTRLANVGEDGLFMAPCSNFGPTNSMSSGAPVRYQYVSLIFAWSRYVHSQNMPCSIDLGVLGMLRIGQRFEELLVAQ